MKNSPSLIRYSTVIATVVLCATFMQSNSREAYDATRTNLGRGDDRGKKIDSSIEFCPHKKWTCQLLAIATPGEVLTRSVPNVAMAIINSDGSIYLQELSSDPSVKSEDLMSDYVPNSYVSDDTTVRQLWGTDCRFAIKPIIKQGKAIDWSVSVRGSSISNSTTVVVAGSGKEKDKATTTTVTTTTNTCGGDVDQDAVVTSATDKAKPKGGKDKGKGPGPK